MPDGRQVERLDPGRDLLPGRQPQAAIDGLWLATGEEIATWVETLDLPSVRHDPPVLP